MKQLQVVQYETQAGDQVSKVLAIETEQTAAPLAGQLHLFNTDVVEGKARPAQARPSQRGLFD